MQPVLMNPRYKDPSGTPLPWLSDPIYFCLAKAAHYLDRAVPLRPGL